MGSGSDIFLSQRTRRQHKEHRDKTLTRVLPKFFRSKACQNLTLCSLVRHEACGKYNAKKNLVDERATQTKMPISLKPL